MINCTVINNETGEILLNDFNIDTIEDKIKREKFIERKKLEEDFKEMQQEYLGYFVMFIFENMDKLNKIFNNSELVKYIYIGTYTKNDGYLMLDNNKTYIDKNLLKKILSLNDKTFRNFYNKAIENELLIEEDKKLKINVKHFYRGKETEYKPIAGVKLKNFVRIYIETTRELYLNTPPKSHRKLYTIYRLIPYVNWKYNILCYNINEVDKDKLEAVTVSDVMNILEYDKTHITRFKNDFYNIKYQEYEVFGSFQKTSEYLKSAIVVNPLVFYRGNNIDELKLLITLFGLKPKNPIN